MRRWWGELRSWAAAVDPGRTRLHMAAVATAAMIVAALAAEGVRTLTGRPVTTLLFAVVLAMVSNLAVNEPTLSRRRVTTALMALPAAGSATLAVLLSPYPIPSDVVFVLVMAGAVAVRRFGPRGAALGMAAFMPYFFVLFLQAVPADLPFLLTGVVIGIGSTFLLRCVVFTRRVENVIDALVRAFEARLHALLLAAGEVLRAPPGGADLGALLRAQTRLNETALLVADRLDEADDDPAAYRPGRLPGGARPGGPEGAESELAGLRQWIVDSELAAERVAMSVRRSVEHRDPVPDDDREALVAGIGGLAAATAVGTPRPMEASLYRSARDSVAGIAERAAGSGGAAREQRIAFAVGRLADAMQTTVEQTRRRIGERRDDDAPDPSGTDGGAARPDAGLGLHTRQALQVGVATSLAIVVGEAISPDRWYWAVIAAFIVYVGAVSRGDVLSRGWARAVGTTGGVVAGMLLAVLVGGNVVLSLVLLFVCVFLALYLVRVSQVMMAFWLTTVLALLYGVIGQFSVETMVLRVEETVVGGALGMLAAYLVLPTRSRTAFAGALDVALTAVAESLRVSVDRALGRPGAGDPLEKARAVDAAVADVRERARPLEHPISRRPLRRGVHHTVRVIGALDHYVRLLAAQAATAHVPEWASTLEPATARVLENLDGLRRLLNDGWGPPGRRELGPGAGPAEYGVVSAEDLIDAAEADAASSGGTALPELGDAVDTAGWDADGAPPGDRRRRLAAARLLRRIDQLAVGLARELCGGEWTEPGPARVRLRK
ncbi:FUSC family protein [Pseudonocardia sp. NPDC049635]|uniref:FUSC family protein n=1 Tax=Pseudonocardia sp. NPDC049635 TaxID=3155506 RepID=UPI0033CF603A